MQYSIVNLSEVKNASNDFLIHAEFFSPKIQKFRQYAKNNNFQKLENYAKYIKNGIQPDYVINGIIPVVRPVNIRENEITDERREYITKDFYEQNIRGQIKYNDILLTASGVGTLGRNTIFKELKEMFLSVDNVILRDLKELLPEFLYIYLNSKYGQEQINILYKGTSGIIHLYPDDIKQILIKPLKIQSSIAALVNTSYTLRQSADALYKESEEILLEELGLKNYQPQNKKCFIKNLSNTKEAGRIDAEYFQPKYEDIIEKIKNYKGGYNTIFSLFMNKKETFKIEKNKIYKYIEIGNINISNSTISSQNIIGSELPANAKYLLNKNDIIISQVRPYRGAIAIVDNNDYIGSGAFSIFAETDKKIINKETLLVFLKTRFILDLSLKYNTGTSYPVITNDDILNFIIPIIPQSVQSIISSKIQQSFENREKSKQLLEVAKKAVEIAIEENEKAGLKYIEESK